MEIIKYVNKKLKQIQKSSLSKKEKRELEHLWLFAVNYDPCTIFKMMLKEIK